MLDFCEELAEDSRSLEMRNSSDSRFECESTNEVKNGAGKIRICEHSQRCDTKLRLEETFKKCLFLDSIVKSFEVCK